METLITFSLEKNALAAGRSEAQTTKCFSFLATWVCSLNCSQKEAYMVSGGASQKGYGNTLQTTSWFLSLNNVEEIFSSLTARPGYSCQGECTFVVHSEQITARCGEIHTIVQKIIKINLSRKYISHK